MKKYRIRKEVYIVLLFLILCFIVMFMLINKVKNKGYSIDYTVDNVDISENYISTDNLYYFDFNYNNIKYNLIVEKDYIKDKKLIDHINKYESEEYTCLDINSEYLDTYPLCSNKENVIDYRLVNDELKEELSSYYHYQENYTGKINNYNMYNKNNNILIWNYKGFNYIKGDKLSTINIFDKDIYEINLSVKINNYIVIANYEQKYNFNEVYVLNLDTEKVEKWKLDYDISFDSYIAGINEYSIFLVDNKNKVEYELVPHKQKMRIVGNKNKKGVIYNNGESEQLSMNKMISDKKTFIYKNNYKFEIEDNKLYMRILENKEKTLISKHDVDKIVYVEKDNVYYISKDNLYKYNLYYGETKLLNYSELEYNKTNMIFINN